MTAEIVHLKFKSPHVDDDTMSFICCRQCRNKTFTLVEDRVGSFPLMRCAACGNHIGRMGWSHDDDPVTVDKRLIDHDDDGAAPN